MIRWLGLDIGGANLKMADPSGFANSESFPLWKHPKRLHQAIGKMLSIAPEFDALAVTMTGELADCFATREEGVCRILEQLTTVFPAPFVRVYSVLGEWLTVSQAARQPWDVAASNWHALASYVLPWAEGRASLLLDVGSTTTDIIPLYQNRIFTEATTDSQRLLGGELVYSGVERTPICAIARSLPFRGQACPVMAEVFATMRDVYLWNGELPSEPECCNTADGRPATKRDSAYRLARMIGEDGASLSESELDDIASQAAELQSLQLAEAMERQRNLFDQDPCERVIISGHGHFVVDAALMRMGWKPERILLRDRLGPNLSRCAPSFAIASLATQANLAVTVGS